MFEEFTKKLTKVMKGMENFSDGDYYLSSYKTMDAEIGILLDGIKAKYINQGSSRATYRLNKDYVIKVAMNNIGVAQNLNEAAYFKLKNSVFNRNVSSSRKGYWIIAEYAAPVTNKKIVELFGCTKGQLDSMISHALTNCKFRNKTVKELYETKYCNHKFFKDLRKLPQMGLITDDISAFYSQNYGISKKGLVVLDGGLTAETARLYY
ncbi:MAG: hypothetical protein IK038_13235 [Bacteroidaceae bacterium]|nr:hypothetical protein [Bacteroidaceae bacterium]